MRRSRMMMLGFVLVGRRPPLRQRILPFLERSQRRRRLFKAMIAAVTAAVMVAMIAASSAGRHHLLLGATRFRDELARRLVGLPPDRDQIEAQWRLRRRRGIELTHEVLATFYRDTTEEMRALFRVAGMDPEHGLIRYGRGDQAFLISSQVFEPDDRGRSYRLRPNIRSVWLRQITLRNG